MKKLFFLLLVGCSLLSCSVDDNSPNIAFDLAKITNSDFPEFFEPGESYDITLTYILPDGCHEFVRFDGGREDPDSNEFFIYALTSYDPGVTDCTEPAELSSTGKIRNFTIPANAANDEDYIFNLWMGTDEDGEDLYETITVPIQEESTSTATNSNS